MYARWFVFLTAGFLTGCYLEGGTCTGSLCLSVATDVNGPGVNGRSCDFDCGQQFQCPDADSLRNNSMVALNFARRSTAFTACGISLSTDTTVTWNETLFSAADRHARDMAANNFVAAVGSDGVTIERRVADLDSSLSNVSQLVAGGFASADALIDEWLMQPEECNRLLDSSVTQYAMACRFDRNTDFGTYWSLILATDQTVGEADRSIP